MTEGANGQMDLVGWIMFLGCIVYIVFFYKPPNGRRDPPQ